MHCGSARYRLPSGVCQRPYCFSYSQWDWLQAGGDDTGMRASDDTVRLGLVDNDPLVLAALSTYLTRHIPSLRIVWTAADPAAVRDLLRQSPVDVVLTDMSMPDMDGVALIRSIRERDNHVAIIAMTSFSLTEYAADAARAGAQTIVSKRFPAHIVQAVRTARSNHPFVPDGVTVAFDSPQAAHRRLLQEQPTGIALLTGTECDIIGRCREGMTSGEIGKELDMTAATVNTHIARACRKVGARNRVQLVVLWMQQQPTHRR